MTDSAEMRAALEAVLFVASELLLFAIEGPFLGASELLTGLVWALYYSGQLMIATGIVGRMHREVTG